MRTTLIILACAIMLAAGLWYFVEYSDTPDSTASPGDDSAATEDGKAQEYVKNLTEPTPQPVPVEKADAFVTPDRVIALLPQDTIEQTTPRELADDKTIGADKPITIYREIEQVEIATAKEIIAFSEGNLDTLVRIVETDSQGKEKIEEITARELLQRLSDNPGKVIKFLKKVRHFEITTPGELLNSEDSLDVALSVIKKPYRIEAATLADLLRKHIDKHPDGIFYLRTVRPTDIQGIWGIVQSGLIENFARGVAIARGEQIDTYTVHIPREADEMLINQTSSFLGNLIYRKTQESFVYNFRNHRMGRNPDKIYPGTEIVIINFTKEELIAIYKHFTNS